MRSARNLSSATYTDGLLIPKINSVTTDFEDICCRSFGFQRFASYGVAVNLVSAQRITAGQTLLIAGGGPYRVASVSGDQVTLYGLVSSGSAPEGTAIPSGAAVTCTQNPGVNTTVVGGFTQPAPSNWLFMAGNGKDRIFTPIRPIRDLTYVAIWDCVQVVAPGYSYTPGSAECLDQVFRIDRQSDKEGMLLRPLMWPRPSRSYCDVTSNTYHSTLKGHNVSLQGDFGYVLPQYDQVTDPVYNPDGAKTDIDPRLEELLWLECEERLAPRPRPGIKSETTAGGRSVTYADTYLAERETYLRYQLRGSMNPEAVMP